MKFELKPLSRDISSHELSNDLKRVAKDLQRESVSIKEYKKLGKYPTSAFRSRFRSWTKALKEAGLGIRKNPKLSIVELLHDLKQVAAKLKKKSITQSEYESYGKYSAQSFKRAFGSWFNALEKAELEKTRNWGISEDEYFKNIEKIWTKLGRQPNYSEIEKPFSKYSAGAYERKFGSWRKALKAFIAYMNEEESVNISNKEIESPIRIETVNMQFEHKTKKIISLKLRFNIFLRDNFKCKKCGRSPATDQTVKLHVDHIFPYSKGGETSPDNLETLCMDCNLGKGNLST